MHNYNVHGKRQRGNRGGQRKKVFRPPSAGGLTERQQARHEFLLEQASAVSDKLAGLSATVVLAGTDCQHNPDQLRPVHRDPAWPNRPAYVSLSATTDQLTLTTSTSRADDGTMKYMNGNGSAPAVWDFVQTPHKGATGRVLDGFLQHALFTAGNNLLQALVEHAESGAQPGEFVLPKLFIRQPKVNIDEAKLNKLVEAVRPELQDQYRAQKRDEAGMVFGGVLFGDADLIPDTDVAAGIREKRAFEDYAALLGGTVPNPARKVLFPANPAKEVIQAMGLPADWEQSLDEETANKLIKEMRRRLPLPEMAEDSDLLFALERPSERLHFSIPIEKVPAGAKVRAMLATFPEKSAVRKAVRSTELVDAIHDPFSPLKIGAYSKVQIFKTDSAALPSYATGSFFPAWGAEPAGEVPLA